MVTLLQKGFHISFTDSPPPLTHILVKFQSCHQGSLKALAFMSEVSKMLQKGTVEFVANLGLGFYSRFFLVEQVTGGWRHVIDLSSLNGFVHLSPF